MKDDLVRAIRSAFGRLLVEDGSLFNCPIEEDSPYDARKLHEVCINHRFANHLQNEVLPLLDNRESMFVDIEFNREGLNYKTAEIDGTIERIRPDIIIHNRKTGRNKRNFAVIECKKEEARREDIDRDISKIVALMTDEKYDYFFGLHVVYGRRQRRRQIRGKLFFKTDTGIGCEEVNCP